jgi:hypothetical protein
MENSNYVQPIVEVVEIEVEKGFATSGGPGESEYNAW